MSPPHRCGGHFLPFRRSGSVSRPGAFSASVRECVRRKNNPLHTDGMAIFPYGVPYARKKKQPSPHPRAGEVPPHLCGDMPESPPLKLPRREPSRRPRSCPSSPGTVAPSRIRPSARAREGLFRSSVPVVQNIHGGNFFLVIVTKLTKHSCNLWRNRVYFV